MKTPDKKPLDILMKLLALPGPSGGEAPVANWIRAHLRSLGLPPSCFYEDKVHSRLPGFSQGNLIVKLPGSRGQQRLLFSAHMDTVPLCRGAEPQISGDRVLPKKKTGLGADNRTGVGALLVLARYLLKEAERPPPVTLLFSVGEEVGLLGAQHLSLSSLGNPQFGFNFDGGDPARIVVGAIGSDRLDITVHGHSAHAGMHPEDGVSAGIMAAKALAWLDENGWHGAIKKGNRKGTANVGTLQGGEATNQVMDQVRLRAETRSHHIAFLDRISQTWEQAFRRAAKVTSATGYSGHVELNIRRQYAPFRLKAAEPVVQRAKKAVESLGRHPETAVINGGLDANPLNAKGLPVVTLGAGQHGAHTVHEYVDIGEYLMGCKLACRLCMND